MATSDIRAGRAFVELVTKDKLAAGLAKAAKKLQSWGATVAKAGLKTMAAGGAIAAPLIAATRVYANMGSELVDASARTGVGVKALSELAYAAEMSGASFDTLETGLKFLQKNFAAAAGGSKEARKAFADIGLTVEDLAGMSPEDKLTAIGDKLAGIKDPAQRTAAALAIMGRGGTALLPMMLNGAKGIDELRKQAQRLGISMSGEDAAAAEAFGDAIETIWKQLRMVTFQVGAAIAGAMSPYIDRVQAALAVTIGWVKENRGVIVAVGGVAVAMIAAGSALVGFGVSLKLAGVGMSGLASGMKILRAAAFGLFSPGGLLVAGLGAAAVAFFKYTDYGQKAMAYLGERFGDLAGVAKTAWAGIADALKAGDLVLAGTIALAALKIGWITLKDFAVGIFDEIAAALVEAWLRAMAAVRKIWAAALATFRGLIDKIGDSIAGAMIRVKILRAEGKRDEIVSDRKWMKEDIQGWTAALKKANDEVDELYQQLKDVDNISAKTAETRASEYAAQMEALDKELQQKLQTLEQVKQRGADARRQELEQEIDALKKQLEALRQQAATAAGNASPGPAAPTPPDFSDTTEEIGALVNKTLAQSRGIFNPMAALGIGGGKASEIARNTKETAQNTARIARQRASQPTFT